MKSAIAKGKESKTSCQQSEQAKEDDRQKITATIPPKSNTKDPLACDYSLYKERHLVECFFQKLNGFAELPLVMIHWILLFFPLFTLLLL